MLSQEDIFITTGFKPHGTIAKIVHNTENNIKNNVHTSASCDIW